MRYSCKVGQISPPKKLSALLEQRNKHNATHPLEVPPWADTLTVQLTVLSRWDVLDTQERVRDITSAPMGVAESRRLHETQVAFISRAVHTVEGLTTWDEQSQVWDLSILEQDDELVTALFAVSFWWNALDGDTKKRYL